MKLNELKKKRQELLGTIEYDGSYPNLCSGTLIIKVGGKEWKLKHVLQSGGYVTFDDNWCEDVGSGPWSIKFPDDFPEKYKDYITEKVNEEVPWGCCGGCV